MCPFLYQGYKPVQELLTDCVGRLERDVLAVMWTEGEDDCRCLFDTRSAQDFSLLDDLERLIREKRAQDDDGRPG